METRECTVVLLPTVKESNLRIGDTYKKLHFNNNIFEGGVYQYLYFLSNDKIEIDDWVYYTDGDYEAVMQIKSDHDLETIRGFDYKKIIATTDKSLTIPHGGDFGNNITEYLPNIPQDFIKSYCNNPVDEIEVEYEQYWKPERGITEWGKGQVGYIPKLINNTIIISPKEEKIYSRSEVEELITKLFHQIHCGTNVVISDKVIDFKISPRRWIKENL